MDLANRPGVGARSLMSRRRCGVERFEAKPTSKTRWPFFFFFRIPGSVINFFVRANKNMCSLFSTKTLPKRDIEAWVSSSCILWDVYIKESICRFFSMVAKGQSLMGDSWFADLSCWQFGTTSSIWWIFGAIRVCESELLRTRKLARKNGGMGATLLVDFGSTTVFN